ncbi:hypothetical protein UPYG_G00059150 [Umbra pygmaea]|uniref:Uncharacterized protein n=1 Tax=Umbra pygmaea TaxID=75934 RepID=A0ABD0XNY5_UMBPY
MTTQVVLHVTRTPVIIMVRVISVVVLLIVIILIIVYRWKYKKTGSVSSTQRGNTGLENNYEGCHGNSDYELIKEQPLQSDPGIAIYSMVNFPRNPSDSLHYASVNFNKNLGKEATVALSKDDTSSCQYATVKLCQSST